MNASPESSALVFCQFLRALGCVTLLSYFALFTSASACFAQGTINPLNSPLTRTKVDLNGDGVGDRGNTAADGVVFYLYWGTAGTEPNTLLGVMVIGTTDGLLTGLPSILAIPGTEPGTVISLQVRASNPQGWYGETDVKQVTLGTASGPGTVLWTSSAGASRFSPLVIKTSGPRGTIAFANDESTRFQIELTNGVPPIDIPPGFPARFGLFLGTNSDMLSLVLTAETSASLPGLINACATCWIPGVQPGESVFAQVRGWSSQFGDDWQRASTTYGAFYGETDVRLSPPFGPNSGPGVAIWQTGDVDPTRFTPVTLHPVLKPAILLTAQGPGLITKTPERSSYDLEESVTLTAVPARWHAFSRWSDGVTVNPRVISVTTNPVFTAIFTPVTPLEALQFGSVTRLAPVGMPAAFADGVYVGDSNAIGRGSVTISLQTTFPNGRMFFTLDGSLPDVSSMLYQTAFVVKRSSLLRVVAFNADFSQLIEFDAVAIHVLPTLNASTKGGGVVSINPPAGAYFSNSYAVVSASAHPGWQFLHWLGDDGETQPTANISMTRNRCVEAVFGSSLTVGATGNGNVFRSASPTFYPYGAIAKLTAIPHPGSYLALWANDGFGTNNPLNFSVTKTNQTITAVFASLPENQEALTIVSVGEGEVSRTLRSNRLLSGTNVTITAIPSLGQDFIGWSGDLTGAQNPTTLSMTNSKVIMATFTRRPVLRVQSCMEGMTDDGFRVRLTSDYGLVYQIESSSNLIQWQPGLSITNEFGVVDFIDTAATNAPSRFYRAVTE